MFSDGINECLLPRRVRASRSCEQLDPTPKRIALDRTGHHRCFKWHMLGYKADTQSRGDHLHKMATLSGAVMNS